MNKLAKASIATGAAILLLMGGAGTLAYWNDSAYVLGSSTAGQNISSGTLTVAAGSTASKWQAQSYKGTAGQYNTAADITIGSFKAVPGDKLTYTAYVTITSTGNNLKVELGTTGGSFDGTDALATILKNNTTVTVDNSAFAAITGPTAGVYSITTPGTYTNVPVKVTITWPDGTTATDNGAKSLTTALSALQVTVKQVYS